MIPTTYKFFESETEALLKKCLQLSLCFKKKILKFEENQLSTTYREMMQFSINKVSSGVYESSFLINVKYSGTIFLDTEADLSVGPFIVIPSKNLE